MGIDKQPSKRCVAVRIGPSARAIGGIEHPRVIFGHHAEVLMAS